MGAPDMMHILLVEDDDNGIQAVCELLADLPGKVRPAIARSRDSAISLLQTDFFDLMILDLKIPTSDDTGSPAPEYGFAVFGSARDIAPGMPIYLLTGSSVEQFISDLLKKKQEVDIWGAGKMSTVSVHKKLNLDTFSDALRPFIEGPHLLEEVELERNGITLSMSEDRLLRIFARRYSGTRCAVWELKGGLSLARVLRVQLLNSAGGVILHAIAKIGKFEDIHKEQYCYEQYIQRLPPGVTPRMITALEFGAKDTAAIFYSLAAEHNSSFFQFALDNPLQSEVAISAIADGLAPWREAATQGLRSIKELREIILWDEPRAAVLRDYPVAWADEFEARSAQMNWGCVHGDFHGLNVLLTNNGSPAIIDYGDIKDGPLSLDPISLELSILFHPKGSLVDSPWPDSETSLLWGDLEQYLLGCPCPEYIRACRCWTVNVAAGKREIAAVAYVYLLRQMKFSTTNKAKAMSLLEGVKKLWEST